VVSKSCTERGFFLLCQPQLRSADFRRILRPKTFLNRKSALHSILFASTKVMHTPRSDFPLHIDIENIYQIRTEKWNASARLLLPAILLERWPQVCCVKIMFELLRSTSLVSTKTNSMKRLVSWIPLNSHVHLNKTQACLSEKIFRFFYEKNAPQARLIKKNVPQARFFE